MSRWWFFGIVIVCFGCPPIVTPPNEPKDAFSGFDASQDGGSCPVADGTACGDACAHQCAMGCMWGKPTPRKGESCPDLCRRLMALGEVRWDLACFTRARACDECR